MIISVRGPCASGKTSLVRRVLARSDFKFKNNVSEIVRKGKKRLFVLGNYRGPRAGGSDAISRLAELYEMISEYHRLGDVLYEGHCVDDRTSRLTGLGVRDVHVIFLTTDIEQCERNFRLRYARGNYRADLPFPNHLTIERSVYSVGRALDRDYDRFIPHFGKERVRRMERDEAFRYVCKLLDISVGKLETIAPMIEEADMDKLPDDATPTQRALYELDKLMYLHQIDPLVQNSIRGIMEKLGQETS